MNIAGLDLFLFGLPMHASAKFNFKWAVQFAPTKIPDAAKSVFELVYASADIASSAKPNFTGSYHSSCTFDLCDL